MYLKAIDDIVIKYPYSIIEFRIDNPLVSLPLEPTDEQLQEQGLFKVITSESEFNELTQNIQEDLPERVDGSWIQKWIITDKPQEEIDLRNRDRRSSMVCTARQARLALLQVGKLATIDAAIEALEEPTKTAVKIEWEYATEVRRLHVWVLALQPVLELTDAEMDQLFELAITL